MLSRRRLVAVAGVLALVVLTIGLAFASLAQGGDRARDAAFDPGATGLSGLGDEARLQGLDVRTLETSPYLLEDTRAVSTVLLVTRLDAPLSPDEARATLRFVERGGKLVVASTDARANSLAALFGVGFDGRAVLDAAQPGAPSLVAASGVAPRIEPLTALDIDPASAPGPVSVLLRTAPGSFLDLNADGTVDESDRNGPFVAGVEVALPGGGRAVFLGGDAIFQNQALATGYVRPLLRHLLPDGGTLVLFEGARAHPAQPAFSALVLAEKATRHTLVRPLLLGVLVAGGGLVAWRYAGAPSLEHAYRGDVSRYRDVPRDRLAEGLRALLRERARERAGLTPMEFDSLSPADRRAFLAAAVPSVAERPGDAALMRSLGLEAD